MTWKRSRFPAVNSKSSDESPSPKVFDIWAGAAVATRPIFERFTAVCLEHDPGTARMKGEQFTAVGIDVGGTKVAAGVVTFPEGKLWSQEVIRTEARRGGEAVLDDVQRLAKKLD